MQSNDGNDSFDAKYGDSKLTWLLDAKLPDYSVEFSDEYEGCNSPHPSAACTSVTPARHDNEKVSSPHPHTPVQKELLLPFSTCNESPINQCIYAASTPFHGQRILSMSSTGSDANKQGCLGNETFDKVPHVEVSLQQSIQEIKKDETSLAKCNLTFEISQNTTFDVRTGNVNRTFDKDVFARPQAASLLVTRKAANSTFTKGNNSTVNLSENTTFSTKSSEKDSGSDMMESCGNLESSGDSEVKQAERKPLSSLPQPKVSSAIPKKNDAKKTSRIAAPRMNTAAISRIQARSPQNKPPNSTRPATTGAGTRVLKKPLSTTRVRKSLLPPSSGNSRLTAPSKIQQKPEKEENENTKNGTPLTPTKRKAQESPKRAGRSPKVSGPHGPAASHASVPQPRPTSAPISRLPYGTRTSRCQRTSGLKGPTPSARASNVNKKPFVVSTNVSSAKKEEKPQVISKSTTQKLSDVPAEGNLNQLAQQIQELESALSTEKQRTEQCVSDLSSEQVAHEQTRQKVIQLLGELENERQKHREKLQELEVLMETKKTENAAKVDKIQQDCADKCEILKNEMDAHLQSELEERMKPYINAQSEVESMTAVLEMKNDTIHKLEAEHATLLNQMDDVNVLSHKVQQLTQKNEDLASQLQEKTDETRHLSTECDKLQRSFTDERNASVKLRRHNEELQYKLESASPSSPSFNPVFTASPANEVFNSALSTPREQSLFRRDEACTPRSLYYETNGEGKETDDTF